MAERLDAGRRAGCTATLDPFSRVDTSKAVHDAILAHHPALHFTLIGEVAAFVLSME
ncbi:hypothetical protein [Neoroseomonas soli]|uniref:Uncharacterized protein n=1 Tax=Neoroseomonas soli TaxID=1081025 RepID=A0A9X9X1R4_9PROT|nr:hypothetical protein [Neoroseomonas soli]MBR0673343.1 hypothetical protein [Neoroseomonas soli]